MIKAKPSRKNRTRNWNAMEWFCCCCLDGRRHIYRICCNHIESNAASMPSNAYGFLSSVGFFKLLSMVLSFIVRNVVVNCLHNLKMCQIVFVFFFCFFFCFLQIFALWFYFVSNRDARSRCFFPRQLLFHAAHLALRPLCRWLNASGFRTIRHVSKHEVCPAYFFANHFNDVLKAIWINDIS